MRVLIFIAFLLFSAGAYSQVDQQFYCYNMICVSGNDTDPEVITPMEEEIEHQTQTVGDIDVNEEFAEYVLALNNPEYIRGLVYFQSAVLYQRGRPAPFFDEMPYYAPDAPPLDDIEPEQTVYSPKVVIGRF